MTSEFLFSVWSFLAGIVFIAMGFKARAFRRDLKLLSEVQQKSDVPAWPKVSLVVPACNEAETIGPALESLLAMDYPNLEIIIVNDRSSDGTGEVISTVQKNDPRLRIVDVTTLPGGWLGKIHALHQGASIASGEWILFSDADVHYEKESLRRAVTFVLEMNLDFLSVIPGLRAKSVLLKSIIAQFMASAMVGANLKKIRQPGLTDCLGGGAFNLARRSVFDRSLGFEWLRLEVLDDTGLALAMKKAGAKCDVLGGLGDIELEWYPSFWAFVRGLEKNGFAIFQFSLAIMSTYVALHFFAFLGLTLAPVLSGQLSSVVFVLSALAFYFFSIARALQRLVPFSSWIVFGLIATMIIAPLIVIRSSIIFLRDKGIYWRGTFYPAAELIANQRLRIIDLAIQGKFPEA